MRNLKGFSSAKKWWRNPESNWGHKAFQASALPTELSRHTFELS